MECPFCERHFRTDESGLLYTVIYGRATYVCSECRDAFFRGSYDEWQRHKMLDNIIFEKEK